MSDRIVPLSSARIILLRLEQVLAILDSGRVQLARDELKAVREDLAVALTPPKRLA